MDKLQRVARAICEARGVDPDAVSGEGPWVTRTRSMGAAQSFSRERDAWPNWRLFETDARAFIAAHKALTDDA
ncbi:MAG: hypothetical protein KAG62_16690 [Caulobacter sp.]|nr:hypothetical protein [Caulobacter sp.]